MLDVLSEIYRNRGKAAPTRSGADRSVHTVGYLLEEPDPDTYLCTVSVFDSEPIAGVPATSMDYTGITAVHVLLDPFTGRPVHVLGPAGELPFGEVPFARDTRHVVTGHIVPPTSTGTYREDEAAWDRYSTMTFGGVTDVWQQGADSVGKISDHSAADADSYTFTDMSFGDESANRTVIVAAIYRPSADGLSDLTSMTIGGVTATLDMDYHSGSDPQAPHVQFVHANVPTGAAGSVVLNFDRTQTLCGIVVWNTPTAVEMYDHSGISTAYVDIPANGFAICARYWESSLDTSTWTNATEYTFDTIADGRDARMASANVTGENVVTAITHSVGGDAAHSMDLIAVYS